MRLKIIVMFLTVFTLAAAASAQNKLSGTLQCGKADPVYTIQVGDRPDHAFTISKLTATWTKPTEIGGIIHKSEEATIFGEVSGNRVRGRGRNVDTMANGDKYYISTEFSEILKDGVLQTAEVTWTITGGTGKFKGMKGKGTAKGKGAADGTSTWEVEGEYELPK
jgi:hypothetical protein